MKKNNLKLSIEELLEIDGGVLHELIANNSDQLPIILHGDPTEWDHYMESLPENY